MAMKSLKESIATRMFIIGFLTFMLSIPAFMIQAFVRERQQRRDQAIEEISSKWGRQQTLTGPILTVPVRITEKNGQGKTCVDKLHFLPDVLTVDGVLNPEIRYRGMYEAVVYNSELNVTGQFPALPLNDFSGRVQEILWQEAVLCIGISDMKGIRRDITVSWDGELLPVNPGVAGEEGLSSGVNVRCRVEVRKTGYAFAYKLNLNGSDALKIVPVGKETKVTLASTWQNPSFDGAFLPESRQIDAAGWSASWRVFHFNRNFPQTWMGGAVKYDNSAFAVRLLMPVDEYQKNTRTSKYAFMFISLTFLTFFIIELLSDRAIHPVQYGLVGLALVLFYTLLLALTEHLVFQYAYLLASLAIISMITVYAKCILKNRGYVAIVCAAVSALYGFLYVLVQMQDYSLLLGAIGLFGILSLVMFLTKQIDWFTVFNLRRE